MHSAISSDIDENYRGMSKNVRDAQSIASREEGGERAGRTRGMSESVKGRTAKR